MKKNYTLYLTFLLFSIVTNAQNKILFDASKAETAGNADWIIDSDLFNLRFTGGPASIGGSESNPQIIPTPNQSGITASTTEDFWKGGISAWAVDCVKKGYTVETLPYNGQITYGVSTNTQDLSNYKLFVIVEPNIDFTDSEKNAIVNFVNNGGSLFMVSDHGVSDRNNDGIDSPVIFNNLMSLNTVQANPFGITFDNNNVSSPTSNIASTSTDPLLNGSFGNVTQMQFFNGSTMTVNTIDNSSVKPIIFQSTASNTGATNVMCAYASFGNGKVVAIGDSSVPDDGTGDTGDRLYDGYIANVSGNHQKVIMNATVWLMTSTLSNSQFNIDKLNFTVAPNPTTNKQINFSYNLDAIENITFSIYDSLGRIVNQSQDFNLILGTNYKSINASDLEKGIYFCKISTDKDSKTLQIILD